MLLAKYRRVVKEVVQSSLYLSHLALGMQSFLTRVLDDVCDEEMIVGRNKEETKRAPSFLFACFSLSSSFVRRTVDPVGNEDVGVVCIRENKQGGVHCVPKRRESVEICYKRERETSTVDIKLINKLISFQLYYV